MFVMGYDNIDVYLSNKLAVCVIILSSALTKLKKKLCV